MKQQLWLIISHLQYFGRRSLRSYTHVSMASSDTESLEALKFESLKEEDDGEVSCVLQTFALLLTYANLVKNSVITLF